MEGSRNKTTILVVVLIILALFAYMFFFKGESEPSSDLVTTERDITEEISTLLSTLERIKLSDGIFTDPTFVNLTNFKLDIIPFPAGRPNPFAPIGL